MIKILNISLILALILCAEIVNAQIIQIQDLVFKNKLLEANSNNTIAKNLDNIFFQIDTNNDGEIQESEAIEVSYLNLDFVSNPGALSSLEGIESFTNIETLITYELAIEDFNYTLNNLLILNLSYHLIEQVHLENLCSLQSFESTQSPSNLANKSLKEIYLKNGSEINSFTVYNGTDLNMVCGDDSEFTLLENSLSEYSGITINSNCTAINCSSLSNTDINNVELELYIFPNPATDYLNIYSTYDTLSYKIINLNGVVILNQQTLNQNEKINISRLSSGFYLISFKKGGNEIYKKFIKK